MLIVEEKVSQKFIEQPVTVVQKLELSDQSMTSEEELSYSYERTFPHGNDLSEDDEDSQLEFVESVEKTKSAEVPTSAKPVVQEVLSMPTQPAPKTYQS